MRIKDPGSATTHRIAMALSILGIAPLLIKASGAADNINLISLSIYIFAMVFLYIASTLYHSIDSTEKVNRRLRKMDHMAIFVMIAGSYTPLCLIALHNKTGYILCGIVWSVAVLGILFKMLWINTPKWISSVLYICMGCLCVLASTEIASALPKAALIWLIAGGVCYIAGGVIYGFKFTIFNAVHKNFGSHEIFHIFIMLGSVCHFILMYCYLALMSIKG